VNIREKTEAVEELILSKHAVLSRNTEGRLITEEKCNIRTDFQRDRDRILHSKAFRRLKHKTQVFIAPEGDHYRTRLTHTLEVSQISRTIARALRLNEDLTEAIALGHDLGHTPFGHTGERVLNEIHKGGFKHNEQSLRVVDILENRKGLRGLNLTYEVRDGILNHSGSNEPRTLEGQIVSISDRIAYINHDIDDSIRANIISKEDIPKDCLDVLGVTHGGRINTMIVDIIQSSYDKDKVQMSRDIKLYTDKLRKFMFDRVYLDSIAKKEEYKAKYIIEQLYRYYYDNFDMIPTEVKEIDYKDECRIEDIICDYIAGMTDTYAMRVFEELYIPKPWRL